MAPEDSEESDFEADDSEALSCCDRFSESTSTPQSCDPLDISIQWVSCLEVHKQCGLPFIGHPDRDPGRYVLDIPGLIQILPGEKDVQP